LIFLCGCSIVRKTSSGKLAEIVTTLPLVVFSGEAQCDTAQNATTLGDVAKLLINLAQMQAGQDPNAAALIKSVSVTTSGTVVKISASLPEDVFQTMLHPQRKIKVAK
jgi:hypothetical protein